MNGVVIRASRLVQRLSWVFKIQETILLLTSSMNSKLNPPTLLSILLLVYNTIGGIGGLLYVDDLALMSTSPRELQAMLNVCQEWSFRNHMQINTQKTKVMAFFKTPSLQKARGGQHQPGQIIPSFHIHAPFPTSSTCSSLIQFEYLGLILDPKLELTMHLATTEAIRRAAHGQSMIQAVFYSLRYDKKRSQLTPTQNLGLWKSTVLPHFLQNLRYIQSTTDVKKLQTSLNRSLARTLHVYGNHTALLADTGVPPLTQ